MTVSNSLLKNTLIYTIGTFGSKVLVFALLPIFSFYLTKSDLGIYDLMMTTVTMLIPLITFQISSGAYRWLLGLDKSNNEEIEKIISSSFFIITIGLIISAFIYGIISLFHSFEYSIYLLLLVITSSYLPYFQILLRGFENAKLYTISGLLNASLLLISNLAFLLIFDLGIKGLFLASIVSNTLTILFILFRGRIISFIIVKFFSKKLSKEMLSFSIPLVPNMISWWLVNSADKYLIVYFLTSEMNGLYAISSRFPTIITLVNSIFILAWQDHTILAKGDKKQKVNYDSKIFDMYVNFEFSIVFILIAASEMTVRFLIAPEFYESYKYMPLIYIGVAFSAFSGYFGASFIKEKKTKIILFSSLIGGLTNLLVCFILIKTIGLHASALGTLISFVVMFGIRVVQSSSFFKIKIDFKKISLLSLIALVYALIISFEFLFITKILFVLSLILFCLLNKKLLSNVFSKITLIKRV